MAVIVGIGLEDKHLDNRGRINRTTVRRGYSKPAYQYPLHISSGLEREITYTWHLHHKLSHVRAVA
jgi:hypothetical protein